MDDLEAETFEMAPEQRNLQKTMVMVKTNTQGGPRDYLIDLWPFARPVRCSEDPPAGFWGLDFWGLGAPRALG